jgi:DNA primase
MVMRRYPDGAAGKSFFMKEAPEPAAVVGTHLPDRSRRRQGGALPVIDDEASLLVGREPRVHRSQPVVRAV